MEENKKEEGALVTWIKFHPKETLIAMGVLLCAGFLFHVYDGYVAEQVTIEQVSAEPLDDFSKFEEKVNISKFSNQVDDLMRLRSLEEELDEVLNQENLDTVKLKELEQRILKTHNNGKN